MTKPKTLTREQVEDLRNGRAPIDVAAVAALTRTAIAEMDRAERLRAEVQTWRGKHGVTKSWGAKWKRRAEKAEAKLAEYRRVNVVLAVEDAERHLADRNLARAVCLEYKERAEKAEADLAEARATIVAEVEQAYRAAYKERADWVHGDVDRDFAAYYGCKFSLIARITADDKAAKGGDDE